MSRFASLKYASLTLATGVLFSTTAMSDQVILDDLIVDGSACIGQDCVNGEAFGFDTIRLKENNLRIKAQDTSTSASFPSNDWQLTFNDSANGGANRFSVDDISGGRTPFTIEAGAPNHSLYVDDGGRIGLGTSTPTVEVHVVDGDTATMRLEQDGSSGFAAQTWDIAGNETNFFVRDVTHGSKLPFRIKPGAPSSSIFISDDGDVGFGTTSPSADVDGLGTQAGLHIRSTDGTGDALLIEETGAEAVRALGVLRNNGAVILQLSDTSANGIAWNIQNRGDISNQFRIVNGASPGEEFVLSQNGDLTVTGDINSGGTTVVPDYVFAPDYELMPIYEVEAFVAANSHLPRIPSAEDVKSKGLNMTEMQMALLEKVEELTLYTIAQQKMIDELRTELNAR